MMYKHGNSATRRHAYIASVLTGLALLGAACATTSYQSAASGDAHIANASVRTEIAAMMDSSARAWNRGDLDGFVAFYDAAMSTTFVTPRKILRGPVAIKGVYTSQFAPGSVRDSLSFENMEVDLLSPDAANVIAYYKLMRGDSTIERGPTSLVMRRRNGGWRIVHDHSS